MNNRNIIFDIIKNIITGIFTLLSGIVLICFSIFLFIKGAGNIEKIVSIPFFVCSLSTITKGISIILQAINLIIYLYRIKKEDFINIQKIENNSIKLNKTSNISNYIYLIGFLIFWFGFLIVFDYFALKSWNDDGSQLFFFSLIFWAAGIYIIYKNIKRNNK